MADILIRPYEPMDCVTASDIWWRASVKAHGFLGEPLLREQRKLIEDVYLPNSETWVAVQGAKSVGFIGLIDNFIGGLFVDPMCQGGGIGRALVAHAAQQKGMLQLDVYVGNPGACAFYRRLGFNEVSRRARDDNDLPFETLTLRLDG